MTTEDRIPRELRERMELIASSYGVEERIIFNRGVILAIDYCGKELRSLTAALSNAKPRLTETPQTVRR